MNKFIGIIIGLVLLLAPIYAWIGKTGGGYWGFGTAALIFLKGGLMWMLILIGAIILLVSLSSLKE